MATFYGGEQLLEIKTLERSTASNAVFYTVPAGRYAMVTQFGFPGDATIERVYNFAGISETLEGVSELLNEGDSLRTNNLGAGYYIFVKEYKKP